MRRSRRKNLLASGGGPDDQIGAHAHEQIGSEEEEVGAFEGQLPEIQLQEHHEEHDHQQVADEKTVRPRSGEKHAQPQWDEDHGRTDQGLPHEFRTPHLSLEK